ncbi:MAG: hypothetical protein J6U65_08850, partial [Bacteroidaceae bacterium]|nr:hypothetical protein [Bacteroidaceae bacterium]
FMLVSLLCATAQVWADKVTDLSQLSNDKVYFIKSERAFLLYSEANAGKLSTSSGKTVGTVQENLADPMQQFQIIKNGNNLYLFSVGAQKYVSANGSMEDAAKTVLNITKVDNATYPWKMCLGNNGMNSQEKNQTNEGILVNSWTTTDPGNCFSIEEAIPMEKTYVITVLGTDDAGAGVSYNGQEYKNEATIETTEVLKKAAFQALAVAGKMAIITVNGMNVYVSYFDEGTKFYTMQNGKGGYVSLNPAYMDGNAM